MPWILFLAAALAQGAVAPTDTATRHETGWYVAPLDTVDSFEVVPVVQPNLETERAWKVGLEWPTRAYDVGMNAVGPITGRQVTITMNRGGGETVERATISVVQLGFLDDSVAGRRDELDLRLQLDGTWRVRSHERSVFCPRGPGRGAWIAGPCQ